VPLSRASFSFSQILANRVPANSGFRRSSVSDREFRGRPDDGSDPDAGRLANWFWVFSEGCAGLRLIEQSWNVLCNQALGRRDSRSTQGLWQTVIRMIIAPSESGHAAAERTIGPARREEGRTLKSTRLRDALALPPHSGAKGVDSALLVLGLTSDYSLRGAFVI
jgi:hypothetical protein